MDQVKIGAFLKDIRKEKGITQEQLAEELGVSGRTISRWETGSNMPDISLLVEIAEFFDISIPEIIKGERKSKDMKEEAKEVAETMSDYAKEEKEHLVKSIRNLSIIGLIAFVVPTFICDFLCIHPFNDGNERMSRLLTLLLLYKNGYSVGKYISIEKQIEKTKDRYYDTLETSDAGWHEEENDPTPFIRYMLHAILACYTEFEERVGLMSDTGNGSQ